MEEKLREASVDFARKLSSMQVPDVVLLVSFCTGPLVHNFLASGEGLGGRTGCGAWRTGLLLILWRSFCLTEDRHHMMSEVLLARSAPGSAATPLANVEGGWSSGMNYARQDQLAAFFRQCWKIAVEGTLRVPGETPRRLAPVPPPPRPVRLRPPR